MADTVVEVFQYPVQVVEVAQVVGPQGVAGADGAASTVPGPAGPAGADGAAGPAGADSTVAGPTGPAGADGAPGSDGLDGATGLTGPAGADGAPGTPASGSFLSGSGVPSSGSGIDALDGTNDPWRWSPMSGGWVSPAFEVTWSAGDEIPPLTILDDNAPAGASSSGVEVYLGVSAAFSDLIFEGDRPFGAITQSWIGAAGSRTASTTTHVAATSGTGFAVAVYTQYDFGQTLVPDPTFDLSTQLGDVVVVGPHEFPEPTVVGAEGDFYLDTATTNLYGPKAGGTWPAPVSIQGFNPAVYHQLTAGLYLGPMSDPDEAPLTLSAGTAPANGYVSAGQAALWYEDTAGAPVLHVKAKDSAGTLFDLTPLDGADGAAGATGATGAAGADGADGLVDPATVMATVNHGATAGTARPVGALAVYWIGTVEPTNAVDGDLWTGAL